MIKTTGSPLRYLAIARERMVIHCNTKTDPVQVANPTQWGQARLDKSVVKEAAIDPMVIPKI